MNNDIEPEILVYLNQRRKDALYHIGTPDQSGRYRRGSGKDPYQHGSEAFYKKCKDLKRGGMSDTEIARKFGMSTGQYRDEFSIAKDKYKTKQISLANRLHDQGLSNVAIGKKMGIPDTTVGNYLRSNNTRKKENDAL